MNRSGSSNSPASILSVRSRNECGVSDTSEFHLAIYTPVTVGGTIQLWNLDITNTGMGYCVEYEPPYTELYASWHSGQGYSLATTFEWYRNGVLMPGEVGQRATITRGGNYSVKVRCGPCSTTLDKGLVKQCLPRITIYPQDSINTCLDSNVMLTVVLDNDGYSGPVYTWRWYLNGTYIQGSDNAYSIAPAGSGVYSVGTGASECQQGFGSYGCSMPKNRPRSLYVTMPPVLTVTQTDDTLFATPGYDSYQWFENGMPLPGETNQKLVLSVDGFYTVEGIFMNGCVESSNPFDSDFMPPPPPEPPGTNPQEELAEQMTVSPNPVSGSFVLKAKVAKEDARATISITDATGSSMFEKEIDVVDGIVEEKIEWGNAPALMGIIRLRSAHTLKTTTFFRK